MKEIILFCYGDSTKASTWSNVPYLMAREFERVGITVDRVNLLCNTHLGKIIGKIYRLLGYGDNYTFLRSELFARITKRKICHAIAKYTEAQIAVFLMFDHKAPIGTIPSLLFSDWTYRMLVEDRQHKQLTSHEHAFVSQQRKAIEQAELVLPLFKETFDKMKKDYPEANIRFIENNVVNIMLPDRPDTLKSTLHEKINSRNILFIGRPAYKTGLFRLIEATRLIKNVRIDIIGMTHEDVFDAPDFCKFHGFLRKDVPEENHTYYELIKRARVVCNPTPEWAGYSSIVECMYCYTPVIVSPFQQFVTEFGNDIDFGRYATDENLATQLDTILSLDEDAYTAMAEAAHERVKDYTWENYVAQMINLMQEYCK